MNRCRLLVGLASVVGAASSFADQQASHRVEIVTFADQASRRSLTGRVLVEDAEGGVLLETADGQQWVVEAQQVVRREPIEAEFKPLPADQLAARVLEDLPEGFDSLLTQHYVVCFNTSRAYAQWTSSLLERLHRAFTNYWSNKGLEIHEPEFPLVVVIYASADQYRAASADELGSAAGSVIGYYNLTTNRVSMFDLTGAEAMRGGTSRGSLREINQMLAQPSAVPLVSTIVHEATHQIAFNCGLHTRLAELPLWLVEGMAVYFEAPDLSSSRGWRGIGNVNYPRLQTFRKNSRMPARSTLLSLIADDKRFRDSRTAVDSYADAWALNYFLIRYHPDKYVSYVEALAAQPALLPRSAEDRIAEFRKHFGDPADVEREFLKRMAKID